MHRMHRETRNFSLSPENDGQWPETFCHSTLVGGKRYPKTSDTCILCGGLWALFEVR